MDAALQVLRDDLNACQALETALRGRPAELVRSRSKGVRKPAPAPVQPGLSAAEVQTRAESCLEACKESRKRHREKADPPNDLSDEALSQYTRFTDGTALDVYKQFLHYVPRLVNVVTASTTPRPRTLLALSTHTPTHTPTHTHAHLNRTHHRAHPRARTSHGTWRKRLPSPRRLE
jgi:hypothetical protein